MDIIGILLVLISLALLMYSAFKGISVIIMAPVLAVFTFLMESLILGRPMAFSVLTEYFMKGMADYVFSYFLIFLLGAIFGKIMDASGCAMKIATFISEKLGKNLALLAVILSCAVLTYGGVSLFVVAFAAYPIGAELFRKSDIPKRFLPATIAVGAITFTMTALPGSPQIQNAIPMKYFGTDAYAGPILGIVGAVIMLGGGYFWLYFRIKKAKANGEGYGAADESSAKTSESKADVLPNIVVAFLPILAVLAINFIASRYVFPNIDLSYLQDTFGKSPSDVIGNWSLITALILSVLLCLATNLKRLKGRVIPCLDEGIAGSFPAIMNTAAVVGYGAVIKHLGAFVTIKDAVTGFSENPLIATAAGSTLLAGITGSASGGLTITLDALGSELIAMGGQMGIGNEVLHRVASLASGGLDSLPHNGAVITLLAVTGMTHKKSYFDICICSVVIPLIATVAAVILGTLGVC